MENIQNTALLVMDMQPAILRALADSTALVANVEKAIAHARNSKIPVLYVIVAFRPGAPEISMKNKALAARGKDQWTPEFAQEWMKIHPAITPRADEIVVTKRRVCAFTGSDLEVILRAQGIQHMVLTGVATGGVVLSTVREAADKDYQLTVLSDGCADADEEIHRVLTTKIFSRQANVLMVEEWIKI